MSTITAGYSVTAAWNSAAPASTATDASAAPGLTRERAYTALSGGVLAALGAPGGTGAGASGDGATGDRVGQVAIALRDALDGATGSADPVAGLIDTVNAALGQASADLGKAGYDARTVARYVAEFRRQLSDQLNVLAAQAQAAATPVATSAATPAAAADTPAVTAPAAAAVPSATASASGAFNATYRLTQRAEVDLLTQEGDVVRIRLRTREGLSATGASATGATGAAAYGALSAYSSTRFSVAVQGSLNADELKAINDVLGQVDTLATQFFSGQTAQAFQTASSLGFDATQLAGVGIDLSRSVRVSLASVGTPLAAPAAAATPASTPDAAAPAAAAAADPTAPAAATPAAAADTPSPDPAATSDASAAPATDATGAQHTLLDFVRQVLTTLGTASVSGKVTISAHAKLQLLAGAVDGAKLDAREAEAAQFLKRLLAAVIGEPPAAAAPSTAPEPTAAA